MSEQTKNQRPSDFVTSRSLLARAKKGDAAAVNQLLNFYDPLIKYWCRRASLSRQDIEDVGQNVLLAVFTKLSEFHHDQPGDTFRGWLRIITRHAICQLHRKRQGSELCAEGGSGAYDRLLEVPEADPGEEDEMDHVRRRACEFVRGEFEERTWEMFSQAVIYKRPTEEIAAAMGVTPAAIRQAKSRVLRRLREQLGDAPD